MAFHSLPFIGLFLPISLAVYEFLRRRFSVSVIQAWLLFVSLLFYSSWGRMFLPVLLGSALANYACARRISMAAGEASKRRLFVFAIFLNVAVLAFFKYAGHHLSASLALPVGLSFYTFSQVAYIFDSASGIAPRYSFREYLLFVSFYPYVNAGPIGDHAAVIPQFGFVKNRSVETRKEDLAVGITLFTVGLFKKAVLADGISIYVTPVFDAAAGGTAVTFVEAWLGAVSFMLQLYFDFSGYSDMAIALARLFGITIRWNFDSPYLSTSIVDFWRRWHMSLSAFLTNYVFSPMALWIARWRARSGFVAREKRTDRWLHYGFSVVLPIMATMGIAGAWHGNGWTYLIFGLLHGFYLSVNHAWLMIKNDLGFDRVPVFLRKEASRLLTLLAVLVSFVFFKATTLPAAFRILNGMIGRNGVSFPQSYRPYLERVFPGIEFPLTLLVSVKDNAAWIILLFAVIFFLPNTMRWLALPDHGDSGRPDPVGGWRPTASIAFACGVMAVLSFWCLVTVNRATEFVYFQF